MKTIFQRELRENLKWAGVIFAVLMFVVYRQIRAPMPSILLELSKGFLLFYAPLAGLVMGVMQTVFETKPDNWAFAVHRPVPRMQIFLAKCSAGLLLVYLALLAPCLLMAAWMAKPGNIAVPFQWRMLGPVTIDALSAGCFYFAGIVLTLRRARWYGSRLLPVCGALMCSIITFGFVESFWQAALITLVAQLICAVAAWSAFAKHGEFDRSLLSRAALGVMLYPGGIGVCVTFACFVQLFTSNNRWDYYRMDRDGQIVHVSQTITNENRGWAFSDVQGNAIAKYENLDLDDPKFADTFVRFDSFIADQRVGPWPLNVIYTGMGYRSFNPSMIALRSAVPPNVKLNFSPIYDVPSRIIRLYDPVTKREIGTVSPSGFAPRSDSPAEQFPEHVLNLWRHVLPFESIVYWLDMSQRRALPIFHAAADDPVFSACETGPTSDPIALIATRKLIHVMRPDGQVLFTAPLPIDQRTMYFNCALLPVNKHLVLWAGFIPGFGERTWFLEFDQDGKLIHETNLPRLSSPLSKRTETAAMGFAIPPIALPVLPRWLFDELVDIRTREFAGVFNLCMMIAAFLSGAATIAIAVRCRYGKAKTLGWTIANLVLGPAGVITMLSLNEWPARETCAACGKIRLIGHRDCVACGTVTPSPQSDGREIFEPADAVQLAM